MGSGWFVFGVVACVVVCSGFVIAVTIMRAAWAQRERDALSSNDLRALEESAVLLIDQLKSEADAAITEIDKRRKALSKLIKEADVKLAELKDAEAKVASAPAQVTEDESSVESSPAVRILEFAGAGMDAADIAKVTGIDCAEVNLVLSLHKKLAA